MQFEPFELERWLSTHIGRYNFAGVNPPPIRLRELVENIDPDLSLVYGPTCGSTELREEISAIYANMLPENVLVTNGTAEANFLVINALIERGDEFLQVIPSYLQAVGVVRAAGGTVKFSHLCEEEDFKPKLDDIAENVSSKTKAIFLTSPNNPTGAILTKDEVRAICEIAEDVGAYVIFDEVIRGLELDGVLSISPVEIYEKGISTASVSKLGLIGLRLGWVAARAELVERCWKIKDYTTLSHSGISDYLASLALRKEKLLQLRKRAREVFKRNLTIFQRWVEDSGRDLSCVIPRAGGSAFPKYKLDIDSRRLCDELLREEGILLSPGDFFGSPKHFRVRYGGHEEKTLTDVLNLFSSFLQQQFRKHSNP